MEQQVIGLEVSKAWLDGYWSASGRRLRVGNDAAGIRTLVGARRPCRLPGGDGGVRRLRADRAPRARGAGVLAAIVNPKRVREFAGSMGLEAKTDRVDAQVIARYGEVLRPAATPMADPARAELGEILACRRRLIDAITVRRQQLEHRHSPAMRARVAKALAFLRREAKELTRLLRQQIQADAALAADAALLTSMPGCGPILAATLLAEMPELGRLDRRKVASLAGLAPVARDSGLRENKRVIKGGRGQVRRPLHGRRRLPAHQGQPAQGPLRPLGRQRQAAQARAHRPHAQDPRHPQRHAQSQADVEEPL